MTEQQNLAMIQLLTAYDRKQSTKRNYNIYGIGHYFGGVETVQKHCDNGAPLRLAILNVFQDRLCDHVLKGMGLDKMTIDEARWCDFQRLPHCYTCHDKRFDDDDRDCPNCNT